MLLCCAIGRAVADPTTQQRADKLFTEGRELLDRKMPAEACAKFEEAIKLDPLAAGTMLNLGLCYEELAKYHSALVWYRKARARASETSLPTHESKAKEAETRLAPMVPAVVLEFPRPIANVLVRIDGNVVEDKDFAHVEIDPGTHALDVHAPGKHALHLRFEVEAHSPDHPGDKTIPIELLDGEDVIPDPGKPRRHLAYGLGAAGAAAFAVTLTFSIIERIHYDNDKTDPQAADDDAHRLRVYGTPAFFVGAALVGTAAYLLYTAPEKRLPDATAWAPVVGPDQLGLVVTGAF